MTGIDPIYIHYVEEFLKLSLWYVHKCVREEDIPFADAVNRRVNIYRHTSLYDGKHHPATDDVGSKWQGIVERLETIHDRHRSQASTAELEEEGLALLRPYLLARIQQEGDPIKQLQKTDRPYGCWSCGFTAARCSLHIDNVYQPKSPLSEMLIPFAASLMRLLRDSQLRCPQIELAHCATWLNSLLPFQSLFPKRWIESSVPKLKISYTMGHWGQFSDRTGDFHTGNGAKFRETGRLPFPELSCECPIDEILEHLEARFPQALH